MNEQIAQLTQMLKTSDHGHILYIYDEIDRYIKNTVSYIKTGIDLGHHTLIIDNKDSYALIYHNLSHKELDFVHFYDNNELYCVDRDLHCETILHHFQQILTPFQDKQIPFRTWAHVEWKEDQDEIVSKLINFEHKANESVCSSGVVSVCAYDGKKIPASLEIHLCRSHDYFMTDYELVKSSIYRRNPVIIPSLSENKKMEVQLNATKNQLKSFITHNLDPVMILDEEDKLVTVNHAFEKTFGWSSNEVLGLNAADTPLIPDGRQFEVNRNLSINLLGENIEGYESVRKTKDGNCLNVMMSSFPLWEEDDKINGRAVIIKDITEKKHAQEALIRTEKLSIAGELAASIAHEIRNPITTVKGFLQLLQAGTDEKWNYYEIMASEIDRIELILSKLLMLAKPQVDRFQHKNISLLIKDVMTLLLPQANMNNVSIMTDFDQDEVVINCEENQMKQVFINFIKNAIDSMPKGGEVVIQMKSIGEEEICIRIIDHGYGIPKHILSKLGQPFYTTKEKGTGLGFMVSKKIIENHQGSLAISSEENKGTTIEVKIPLLKESPPQTSG